MSAVASAGNAAQAAAMRQLAAAQRMLRAKEAEDSLIDFTTFTMPDPDDPDDANRSRYNSERFHRALAAALEEVEKRQIKRLIITFPPRHGKSELTSRRLPAWLLGRDPYRHVMLGTYNQDFANDFGAEVRDIMQDPTYATVFPHTILKTGSKAKDRLGTTRGGRCVFVGRGGSATGRGADYLIVDDPFKDSAEARSPVIRDEVWSWFRDTLTSRLMSDLGVIIIIQTRWHEDDLVGRLTDPENPHYSAEEASRWKVINFRALAEEDDVLGRELGEPLWPERFSREYLEREQRSNPVSFSALYQQHPSPSQGAFFKSENLLTYRHETRPGLEYLRIYGASDHAVSTKQENDRTCLLIVGVDSDDVIWLLDCWWQRAPSDKVVEAMIDLQQRWRPLIWWAEVGHITKSLGPFLRKRERERRVYLNIRPGPVATDKVTRAQSIQARSAMNMVRFPRNSPWGEKARQECLRFPNARHDDFVDALAHIGLGLDSISGMSRLGAGSGRRRLPRVGTLAWVKHAAEGQRQDDRRRLSMGGM
jgi:predicted phage terminase large subunit-like protein